MINCYRSELQYERLPFIKENLWSTVTETNPCTQFASSVPTHNSLICTYNTSCNEMTFQVPTHISSLPNYNSTSGMLLENTTLMANETPYVFPLTLIVPPGITLKVLGNVLLPPAGILHVFGNFEAIGHSADNPLEFTLSPVDVPNITVFPSLISCK